MLIRPEQASEQAAIHAVHRAAFPTAVEAQLVDALRAAGRLVVSLVAQDGGRLVAHVAFSPVTLSAAPDVAGGVGLGPVGVLPEVQGGGIGGQVVRAGLAACAEAGYAFVVVLGDPAYYHRFGFHRASEYGLGNEYGAGAEFMVLALRDGGMPTAGSVVRYAPEFSIVGA